MSKKKTKKEVNKNEVLENENTNVVDQETGGVEEKDSKIKNLYGKVRDSVKKNGKKVIGGVLAGAAIVGAVAYALAQKNKDETDPTDYVFVPDEDEIEDLDSLEDGDQVVDEPQ